MTTEIEAAAAQIAAQEEMVTIEHRQPSIDMSGLPNTDQLPAIAEQLWSALASCVYGIEQTIDAEENFKDELVESRAALKSYEDWKEGQPPAFVKSSGCVFLDLNTCPIEEMTQNQVFLEDKIKTLQSALESATETNQVLAKRLAKTMKELAEARAQTQWQPIETAAIKNIRQLEAENARITAAAQAVIDRWHTPKWKDEKPTGDFIYALRDAIAKEEQTKEQGALGALKRSVTEPCRHSINNALSYISDLKAENARLREENAKLIAPMGVYARGGKDVE